MDEETARAARIGAAVIAALRTAEAWVQDPPETDAHPAAAHEGLMALLAEAAQSDPQLLAEGVARPLLRLGSLLNAIRRGSRPDALAPRARIARSRPPARLEQQIAMRSAAEARAALRAVGMSAGDAEAEVARTFNQAGVTRADGKAVSARTIRDWKDLAEAPEPTMPALEIMRKRPLASDAYETSQQQAGAVVKDIAARAAGTSAREPADALCRKTPSS